MRMFVFTFLDLCLFVSVILYMSAIEITLNKGHYRSLHVIFAGVYSAAARGNFIPVSKLIFPYIY